LVKKQRNKLRNRQKETVTSAFLTLDSYYNRATNEESRIVNKRYLDIVREEFHNIKEALLEEQLLEQERQREDQQEQQQDIISSNEERVNQEEDEEEELLAQEDFIEDVVNDYEEEDDGVGISILLSALSEDFRAEQLF
jgi:hypothetical protein